MAAGFNYNTDLYGLYNVVQNTMIRYPKDLIIASLRDFFSQDSKYHFVKDSWGFANTPDHTDLPPDAGLYDSLTTRVFIGESNRFDVAFYPAVLIKAGSFRYVPISFNRNQYYVENKTVEVTDGYNRKFVLVPDKFVLAGAWEGSINIDILSRAIQERDDLVELISLYFTDLNWNNLSRVGLSIRPDISISAASETDDRNDKMHRSSITLNIRGEWRREIPVGNVLDVITFCVEYGDIRGTNYLPNLETRTKVNGELEEWPEEQFFK
jgi:hypothetical protein